MLFQVFRDQVSAAESWLSAKEQFLKREEAATESVDKVDALAKAHDAFEQTLAAQSDKVDQLQGAAKVRFV